MMRAARLLAAAFCSASVGSRDMADAEGPLHRLPGPIVAGMDADAHVRAPAMFSGLLSTSETVRPMRLYAP